MSEVCCKFQIPESNIVGGVGNAETRTLLQSVTDGWTDRQVDGRTYRQEKNCAPPPLHGGGIKISLSYPYFMYLFLSGALTQLWI